MIPFAREGTGGFRRRLWAGARRWIGARARSRGRKPAVGTPIRSSAKTREDPFPGPLS